MRQRTEDFVEELKKHKKLLILTHNNPDPDAICSAMILSRIAKKYGVSCDIAYGGVLKRKENVEMVKRLHVQISMVKDIVFSEYDGFALVDTQKGAGNHALPQEIEPHITFDHHNERKISGDFNDIDVHAGATVTMLMEYLEEIGDIEVDEQLATAFCYAISAETQDFCRGFNEKDVKYYKKWIAKANLATISKIRYVCKPMEYYDFLAKAIKERDVLGDVFISYVGKIPLLDYIPEIADQLTSVSGVSFVLILGHYKEELNMSCRASKDVVDLASVMDNICKNYSGSGGGHRQMAAGKCKGDWKTIAKEFASVVETMREGRK